MANPLLSVRIPQELMDAINTDAVNYPSEDGRANKSSAVIHALMAYYRPSAVDEMGQLRRRLEVVEQKLVTIANLGKSKI